MSATWKVGDKGGYLSRDGGWSIARYPGVGFQSPDGMIRYLLFKKTTTVLGDRQSRLEVVDRREVSMGDVAARLAAVNELKNLAVP